MSCSVPKPSARLRLGPPSPGARGAASALAEIRREVRRQGLDRPAPLRLLLELTLHCALLGAGLAGFLVLSAPAARAAALALALLGHVGVTTSAHTWAHRGGSGRPRLDDLLAFFSGGLVSGIGFLFWHDKHNRRHHGAPNVRGVDPDHDFWPFAALTEEERRRGGRWLRCYHRWQWLALPLLLAVMIPRMKLEGWVFAARRARAGPERRLARLDLAVLCAGNAAWWGLPLLALPPAEVLVLNLCREVGLSWAFFVIFAPAHLPREAVALARRPRGDFVLAQTATTLGYRPGRVAGFFLSGLQYQLEHHLVPRVPHVHYARIAPIVERVCARHGYPYRVLGWGEGLRRSLSVLRTPKPLRLEPEAPGAAGSPR